jgi:methionyl-tRNA formyltransferase
MSKIKIVFFGTPEFSVPSLKALISDSRFEICAAVTQPDRPSGRGQKLQASAVKQVALENNIPVFQPTRLKTDLDIFLNSVAAFGEIDFGIVIAFGQILPKAILDWPTLGCINVHASLLPRWRGAAPIHRALLAGDKETGVCIMQMDTGLDTGAVFKQKKVLIDPETNGSELHDKLAIIGAELLVETLPQIKSGEIEAIPQSEEGATYASKISPQDFKIDWNKTAAEIALQIKAFYPKPGAFGLLDEKRLKILSAEILEDQDTSAKVGQIISASSSGLLIQCKDSLLRATEIQLEGKKAMKVEEAMNGYQFQIGTLLK